MECLPTGLRTVVSRNGLEVGVYYLECMAQATYIVSHGESAFIVDPRRDVDSFIAELDSKKLKLKGILETHFHADFVSGHYELMQKTGTEVYFGPGAAGRCKFPVHEAHHNEVIEFTDSYLIKVLHTPGHTLESVVYLVVDRRQDNRPLLAFTGDTLFIGSCGRPDLVGSVGYTAEHMSRLMFKTLKEQICTLPDDVQVFPAHGAGSPCGKNLGSELYSTIGNQKLTNPALGYTDEDEFVKFLTSDQPTAPQYFSYNVQMNTEGARPVCEELCAVARLSPEGFNKMAEAGDCTVIDTRSAAAYSKGHVRGALNVPLGEAGGTIVGVEDGNFAIWVGTLVASDASLLLVNYPDKHDEALQRLARIAYTKVKGVLAEEFSRYREAGFAVESSARLDLRSDGTLDHFLEQGYGLLDVRTEGEFASNSAKSSTNLPLARIQTLMADLDKDKRYIVYCGSGYRSTIACSLLRQAGFDVSDLWGGFAAISVFAPTHTTTGKICPAMKGLIDTINVSC